MYVGSGEERAECRYRRLELDAPVPGYCLKAMKVVQASWPVELELGHVAGVATRVVTAISFGFGRVHRDLEKTFFELYEYMF